MNGRTIRGGKQYVTQKEQQRYNAYCTLEKEYQKVKLLKLKFLQSSDMLINRLNTVRIKM